jgi:hypothetical protein
MGLELAWRRLALPQWGIGAPCIGAGGNAAARVSKARAKYMAD